MIAALVSVPAATVAVTVPLVFTVVMATAALVGIAIAVRHLRRNRRLTPVDLLASGVSAAGILVSALLITVALGSASAASATSDPMPAPPAATTPNELSGLQLPTE